MVELAGGMGVFVSVSSIACIGLYEMWGSSFGGKVC